jgi:mitogen-activated protein kinase 1/3
MMMKVGEDEHNKNTSQVRNYAPG